jgi:MFS family permease
LATTPSLPVLVGTLALVGLVSGPINPLLATIRHERIPAELRGRVFGTFSAIALVAQPLGLLLAGFLIDGIRFRPTVLLLAGGAQPLGVVSGSSSSLCRRCARWTRPSRRPPGSEDHAGGDDHHAPADPAPWPAPGAAGAQRRLARRQPPDRAGDPQVRARDDRRRFVPIGRPSWAHAAPPRAFVIAALFVTGLAVLAPTPLASTVLQEPLPAELLGRILGAFPATVLVAAPLGILLTGAQIETVGLRPLLLAQGIACFAITLSIAANPAFRELDGEGGGQ